MNILNSISFLNDFIFFFEIFTFNSMKKKTVLWKRNRRAYYVIGIIEVSIDKVGECLVY